MKKALQGLVALLFLWMVFRNVEVKALAAVIGRLQFLSLTTAVTLFFLAWCVATSKWRLLWRKATWWEMLKANFASQFYSLILPGQLAGEAVKTYRIGQRFSDTATVAASVLVDRATSLLGLLLLAFAGVLLSTSLTPSGAVLSLALSVVAIVGVLYAIALRGVLEAVTSVIDRIGRRHAKLQGLGQKAIEFLSAWMTLMARPGAILAAVLMGMVFQVISVSINYIVASDLGIDVRFADWCWIIGLVSVALLLPITIAGVGVREGTYVGLLGLLGVSIEKALAVSIVVFGIALLGGLVGGIVEFAYLLRGRLGSLR